MRRLTNEILSTPKEVNDYAIRAFGYARRTWDSLKKGAPKAPTFKSSLESWQRGRFKPTPRQREIMDLHDTLSLTEIAMKLGIRRNAVVKILKNGRKNDAKSKTIYKATTRVDGKAQMRASASLH